MPPDLRLFYQVAEVKPDEKSCFKTDHNPNALCGCIIYRIYSALNRLPHLDLESMCLQNSFMEPFGMKLPRGSSWSANVELGLQNQNTYVYMHMVSGP